MDFMTCNVYEPHGTIVLYGTCLERMEPEIFRDLTGDADFRFAVCLEQTHVNMVVTKLAAMLGTGRVTRVRILTVDRSPHCIQLHYLAHEIARTMPKLPEFQDFVVLDGAVHHIRQETIELSKTLSKLEECT